MALPSGKCEVGRDIKDQISGFEAAAAEMETTMKAVRELDIEPHNEMKSGKLPDTFSAFKKRMGPMEGEESETTLGEEELEEEESKEKDDEVDFDVSDEDAEFEEEQEEEEDQPEEPPEPVWPDIMNGPLTGARRTTLTRKEGDVQLPLSQTRRMRIAKWSMSNRRTLNRMPWRMMTKGKRHCILKQKVTSPVWQMSKERQRRRLRVSF